MMCGGERGDWGGEGSTIFIDIVDDRGGHGLGA